MRDNWREDNGVPFVALITMSSFDDAPVSTDPPLQRVVACEETADTVGLFPEWSNDADTAAVAGPHQFPQLVNHGARLGLVEEAAA